MNIDYTFDKSHIALLPALTIELCNEDFVFFAGIWHHDWMISFTPPKTIFNIVKWILP